MTGAPSLNSRISLAFGKSAWAAEAEGRDAGLQQLLQTRLLEQKGAPVERAVHQRDERVAEVVRL